MKFRKFGKALLMSAISAGLILGVTSCVQSFTVGFLFVTGNVTSGSTGAGYITPERPSTFWFKNYDESARRFRDIAAKEGADVIIANHTIFDGSKTKLPAVLARKANEPNPYVVGKEGVLRYMTTVDECAQAGLTRLSQ